MPCSLSSLGDPDSWLLPVPHAALGALLLGCPSTWFTCPVFLKAVSLVTTVPSASYCPFRALIFLFLEDTSVVSILFLTERGKVRSIEMSGMRLCLPLLQSVHSLWKGTVAQGAFAEQSVPSQR